MVMQESGEMCLEAIYRLSQSLPVVRSIDVSEYIGYSKPSVSRAIGILKKQEYITVDRSARSRSRTRAASARSTSLSGTCVSRRCSPGSA